MHVNTYVINDTVIEDHLGLACEVAFEKSQQNCSDILNRSCAATARFIKSSSSDRISSNVLQYACSSSIFGIVS